MTEQARVIVVGGGIVGCSILYHLAKAGCKDALLLERNELTSGATWHAAGNVHTQNAYPNLSTLQAYSLRLYDELAEEVGQEVGSHIVGGFFLGQTKERMQEFKMRQEGDGLLAGAWERDCRAAWGNRGAPWDFGQELFDNDLDRLEPYMERICERVPAFAEAGIKRCVNGAISFAPDARPMIGPLPGVPGFFVACGFLGGIAQAGGIGLAMSQWILEGEPELDLSFIDVGRFGEWTTKEFARVRAYEVYPLRYEIIYPQMERQAGRLLRVTPIYPEPIARGAVMGQAFGWERPLWYAPQGVEPVDQPSFSRPS